MSSSTFYATFNQYLMYLSGCFYYLSSTLNPVLYNLMSTKYRNACKAVMFCQPTTRSILSNRRTSQASDKVDMNKNQRMLVKQNRSSSMDASCSLPVTGRTNLGRQCSVSDEGRLGTHPTLTSQATQEETEHFLAG